MPTHSFLLLPGPLKMPISLKPIMPIFFTPRNLHEELMEASAIGTDVGMIVQIGVGFYSTYLMFEKSSIVAPNAPSSPALKKLQDSFRRNFCFRF